MGLSGVCVCVCVCVCVPNALRQAEANQIGVANSETHDAVFFMRASHTRSPAYSTLFWLGDQLVTWDEVGTRAWGTVRCLVARRRKRRRRCPGQHQVSDVRGGARFRMCPFCRAHPDH